MCVCVCIVRVCVYALCVCECMVWVEVYEDERRYQYNGVHKGELDTFSTCLQHET